MKYFIYILMLALPTFAHSQASVLLLKKNGKTIHRYYTGNNFVFTTKDGMQVRGQLDSIVRDSLYLTYFQEQRVATQLGSVKTQVTGKYDLKFSMANVGSLPRPRRSGLVPGILILGGLGYTTVNIINTVADGDPPFGKNNIGRIATAMGAAAIGWLILRSRATKYILGKKFTLDVVN